MTQAGDSTEQIAVAGWWGSLRASGTHTVAILLMFLALCAIVTINWIGLRDMRDEWVRTAQVMTEMSKRRDAQYEEAKRDHRDILRAIEAATGCSRRMT